jgi:hypothetical protein
MGHDPRCPAVQAQPQGDVVVDALAGERAEQDQEREQGDQHARAEQYDLIGKVDGLELHDEALREGSFKPITGLRYGVALRAAR